MKYSEQDFASYLEYLLDDRRDFFDKKFVSRLERQTQILKRLINVQAAEFIANSPGILNAKTSQ